MKQQEFGWQAKTGQRIYAQNWQPEQEASAVVILIHGLGEHIGRYQYVVEKFTQAGIAMVGCDLPGHGKTEGIRGHFSFENALDEIDYLIEETARMYPGKPRFLYGHSMGGALVLFYTLHRQPTSIAGTIVTSPGLGVAVPVPAWKFTLAKIMARLNPSFSMPNGLDRDNLSHDASVIQAYNSDPLVHDRVSARLGLDLLTQGDKMLALAGNYPLPILLMQGSKDHIVSLQATEAFSQRIPSSLLTYKVWENLYHETHNEYEKDQVIQTMIDWLNLHL